MFLCGGHGHNWLDGKRQTGYQLLINEIWGDYMRFVYCGGALEEIDGGTFLYHGP
jgi:hypothetical protein